MSGFFRWTSDASKHHQHHDSTDSTDSTKHATPTQYEGSQVNHSTPGTYTHDDLLLNTYILSASVYANQELTRQQTPMPNQPTIISTNTTGASATTMTMTTTMKMRSHKISINTNTDTDLASQKSTIPTLQLRGNTTTLGGRAMVLELGFKVGGSEKTKPVPTRLSFLPLALGLYITLYVLGYRDGCLLGTCTITYTGSIHKTQKPFTRTGSFPARLGEM